MLLLLFQISLTLFNKRHMEYWFWEPYYHSYFYFSYYFKYLQCLWEVVHFHLYLSIHSCYYDGLSYIPFRFLRHWSYDKWFIIIHFFSNVLMLSGLFPMILSSLTFLSLHMIAYNNHILLQIIFPILIIFFSFILVLSYFYMLNKLPSFPSFPLKVDCISVIFYIWRH